MSEAERSDRVSGERAVTADDIIRILNANNAKLKDVIFEAVPRIPAKRTCPCATALANARL